MSRHLLLMCGSSAATLIAIGVTGLAPPRPIDPQVFTPPSLGVCSAKLSHVVARTYDVRARVKVLLFWTGGHDEGSARIAWSTGPGDTRRTDLLIGTDPARAYRHLNRWGYITEAVCGARAEVIGLMTTSNEASIDDAKASLGASAAGDHAYRAIRATFVNGEAATDLLHLSTAEDFTYRDLAALVERLPAGGSPKRVTIPADTDPGFLAAVSGLLNNDIAGRAPSGRGPVQAQRRYLYAGTTYQLRVTSSKMRELAIDAARYPNTIDMEFEILNLKTHETTAFGIAAGTTGDLAGVPLRIVYRPRWWLELELTLVTPAV